MTRIDSLPENQLSEEVKSILRDIEELKAKQFTGSNNLVVYHTQTANTWDVDEIVSGALSFVQWRATFTPDTVSRPFTQFQFTSQSTYPSNYFSAYIDPANIDSPNISFVVEMINNDLSDSTTKLKFAFKSLDTGTVSWVRSAES